MKNIFQSRTTAVVAGAATLALLGTTGAVAAGQLTSRDIANESIRSVDVKDGNLRLVDLNDYTKGLIKKAGPQGPQGEQGEVGPAGPQGEQGPQGEAGADGQDGADGEDGKDGQDGVSNLIAGAGYTDVWAAGSYGESISTCPEGQYAIGGGYSLWGGYPTNAGYDLGGENTDIQVTVSAPYFKGEYVPVDEAGNFRPDQWVVRGFNGGDTEQIVRAWVTCADIAD